MSCQYENLFGKSDQRTESYTPPVDKVQSYFSELTVTPHYQQKGVYNPFYTLNIDVEKDIRPTVGKGVIKFQNVLKGQGKLLKDMVEVSLSSR